MTEMLSDNNRHDSNEDKKTGQYELLKYVGYNPLFESWEAKNRTTDTLCFLKLLKPKGTIDQKTASALLTQSFALQKNLHCKKLVTARKKSMHEGVECIEYPYYQKSTWKMLRTELLWPHYQILLPQMFQLIDYLHLMGLVHRDIKIENFLVNTTPQKPIVHLIDFDFLTTSGSHPQGIIVGSPELIAPEILTNEGVYPESDIYALGKSLTQSLDEFILENPKQSAISRENLNHLQTTLAGFCVEDRYHRPRVLLDAPLTGNTKGIPHDRERRRLLTMFLHTQLKEATSKTVSSQTKLTRFARLKCRVFGLPNEIVLLHTDSEKQKRPELWKSFLSLLKKSEVTQFGDFWSLRIPREAINEAIGNAPGAFPKPVLSAHPREILSKTLDSTARYQEQEYYWCGLFYCESALSALRKLAVSPTEYHAPLLRQMANLSQQLYLLQEADAYFAALTQLQDTSVADQLNNFAERARLHIRMGKSEEAKALIEEGLKQAAPTHSGHVLILRQLLGWVEISLGNIDIGKSILSKTLEEAKITNVKKVAIQTLYSLGYLHWQQGNFSDAISYFEDSVREANENNAISDALPSISALAFSHCEQGNYTKGLTYCKQFIRVMDPFEHHSLISFVYLSIIFAYTRLVKHEKAEFWAQRYLEIGGTDTTPFHLHVYAQQQTFIKLTSGNISDVRKWAAPAIQLGKQLGSKKTLGKVYHNLAEVELMTGHADVCITHIIAGHALFSKIDDQASITELKLIQFAAEKLYHHKGTIEQLTALLTQLQERNCTYYAALGYLYLFIFFTAQRNTQTTAATKALIPTTGIHDVPLFSALDSLCRCYGSKDMSPDDEIVAWRQAFVTLNQSKQRFLALLCVIELIELLKKNNRYRQAERYATMAQSIADRLDNSKLITNAGNGKQMTPSLAQQNGDLISVFHSISELMKNATDYTQTLQFLLRFAVNQSGAERGVLFLSGASTSGLRVLAAIGCDEQSQADAEDFSKSIVNLSVTDIKPLIVNNALDDPRTNRYRSIIKFNILSVVAVPLRLQNKLIGVLYLDHHVIPSLFTEEDIRYIETIANFISQTLGAVQDIRTLRLERDHLAERAGVVLGKDQFLSADPNILKLLEQLSRVAASNAPVLLLGESGTGKELIAEEIHRRSDRAKHPFIRLNCAAIPPDLIEITLFGAIKGAATGITAQEGKFRAADTGTLFLDEIADMELHVQAKVLRAIETQTFSPVGSNRVIHTDIRFICATNKNLEQLIKAGKFREDLYHRIAVIELEIPPLRERVNDIQLLIDHFLNLYGKEAPPQFTVEARTLLNCYIWSGNVRELKNFVERMCIMHPGELIDKAMLPPEMRDIASDRYTNRSVEATERAALVEALRKANGNQSKAARSLGMSLSTFRRKLKKYGLL